MRTVFTLTCLTATLFVGMLPSGAYAMPEGQCEVFGRRGHMSPEMKKECCEYASQKDAPYCSPDVPEIPGTRSPETGTNVPRDADTRGSDEPGDPCKDAESRIQQLYQESKNLEAERLKQRCNLGGAPPGRTAGGGPEGFSGGSGGGGGGSPGGGGSGDGGGSPGVTGGSGFGGGKGGRQVAMIDVSGPRPDDPGKGAEKWAPWKREPVQPAPGLDKERLTEILAALDEFASLSQGSGGNVNLPALSSILESARRESDLNRLAEILKAVIAQLIAALQDRAPPVRRGAADALGKIAKTAPAQNDPARQAEMQKTSAGLQNGDPAVRRQSAETLGRMGHEAGPAIPALVNRLEDQDASVRNAAADALKNIGQSFFETPSKTGPEERYALCVDLSWTGLQISAFSCDLAAR